MAHGVVYENASLLLGKARKQENNGDIWRGVFKSKEQNETEA